MKRVPWARERLAPFGASIIFFGQKPLVSRPEDPVCMARRELLSPVGARALCRRSQVTRVFREDDSISRRRAAPTSNRWHDTHGGNASAFLSYVASTRSRARDVAFRIGAVRPSSMSVFDWARARRCAVDTMGKRVDTLAALRASISRFAATTVRPRSRLCQCALHTSLL